jgi:hypothetical protein
MLSHIAFVCAKINDGLTESEILTYSSDSEKYDKGFVSFCINFGVENNFLQRKNTNDRYSLTEAGKEFVTSQFG